MGESRAAPTGLAADSVRIELGNPARGAHREGIVASHLQKGVEIDPFKVRIVQLLPKP